MLVAYARVSTQDQNLHLQTDALERAGAERIFQEKVGATAKERPELSRLLEHLRPGDVLLVWKLDRLGRSLKHLVDLVQDLEKRGIGLRSLNDPIDTTTPQGRLVFNIFASLAEFERDIIRERTNAGLSAARARGKKGGRPKGLSPEAEKTALAAESLYQQGQLSVLDICRKLSISKATLYSYLKTRGVVVGAVKGL